VFCILAKDLMYQNLGTWKLRRKS